MIVYCYWGRAIAQAASRWLPTAAARVRARVWQVGFVVGEVASGQVFSEYFGFPCEKPFIPWTSPSQSPGAVSRGFTTSWSPVRGVQPTVLDLVTETKRKVSWRRSRPQNGAVEPQERKIVLLVTYLSVCISVYLWLYSPLLCFGRIFIFLILYAVGRTPLTGDQPVARPLPTHRTTQIQNKRTQTSMPWMGLEATIQVFEWARSLWSTPFIIIKLLLLLLLLLLLPSPASRAAITTARTGTYTAVSFTDF
jgi:hypothetical protein